MYDKIYNHVKTLVIISVLFSPIFFLVIKPLGDVSYHIYKPSIRECSPVHAVFAVENSYVSITGTISPESLYYVRDGVLDLDPSFLFTFTESDRRFVVHLRKGRLYDTLLELYRNAYGDKIDLFKNTKSAGNLVDTVDQDALEKSKNAVDCFLKKPVTICGRIHSSSGYFYPFQSYYFGNTLDIEEYYRQLGLSCGIEPEYKRKSEQDINNSIRTLMEKTGESEREFQKIFDEKDKPEAITQVTLLAGEELPDWKNLIETNLVLFVIPFLLLFVPILLYVLRGLYHFIRK